MTTITNEANKVDLTLIDGEFLNDDARDLLVSLLTAEINFHKIKNLRSQVRSGVDDEYAQNQISSLKVSVEKLSSMISQSKMPTLVMRAQLQIILSDI